MFCSSPGLGKKWPQEMNRSDSKTTNWGNPNPAYQHQRVLISESDSMKRLLLIIVKHKRCHTGTTRLQMNKQGSCVFSCSRGNYLWRFISNNTLLHAGKSTNLFCCQLLPISQRDLT